MENGPTVRDIIDLVHGTIIEPLASQVLPVKRHGLTYKSLFEIHSSDWRRSALKIRRLSQRNVRDSLRFLSSMDDDTGLIQRYSHVVETDTGYLLVSDWIDGSQPFGGRADSSASLFG